MICSFPFLDTLGYAPACALHDNEYDNAQTYRHKFKRDAKLARDMRRFVKAWHAWPISFATFVVLSANPFSYYKYFVNKNNAAGHLLSTFWLGLSIYQTWSYFNA